MRWIDFASLMVVPVSVRTSRAMLLTRGADSPSAPLRCGRSGAPPRPAIAPAVPDIAPPRAVLPATRRRRGRSGMRRRRRSAATAGWPCRLDDCRRPAVHGLRGGRSRRALAHDVDRAAVSDDGEPGDEGAPRIVGLPRAMDGEQGFLHDIVDPVRRGAPRRDGADQAEYSRAAAPYRRCDRRPAQPPSARRAAHREYWYQSGCCIRSSAYPAKAPCPMQPSM